jgi:hypothetical protein
MGHDLEVVVETRIFSDFLTAAIVAVFGHQQGRFSVDVVIEQVDVVVHFGAEQLGDIFAVLGIFMFPVSLVGVHVDSGMPRGIQHFAQEVSDFLLFVRHRETSFKAVSYHDSYHRVCTPSLYAGHDCYCLRSSRRLPHSRTFAHNSSMDAIALGIKFIIAFVGGVSP